ncbi:MAG: hypothetical protein JO265_08685 [Acidimicrobiia bacterium]|nr:hypothetical protein [Acidimicrobiia bacterium]
MATAFAPTARAAQTFSAVNGTASGAAIHLLAGSNAFPNFRTGAVDNRYPLAQARVDNSPTAEGTASPLDTGPLGQTAVATFNSGQLPTLPPPVPSPPTLPPGPQLSQPQYADARFPPGSGNKPVTVGSVGGPYAAATAIQNEATAQSELVSAPPGASPSATSLSKLDAVLNAWRLEFLTAADSRRFPAVHPDAAQPDGADGVTGTATAVFDDGAGILTVSGDARVAKASFGGGAIALFGLHSAVQIVNDGEPKHSITTEIANATVGGVPVTLGPDGVSVNGTQLPGVGQAVQQASAALNTALAQAGYHIATVTPATTKSDNQETITAAAAVVTFQQPGAAGGIPQQFFDYSLGEVFADSLASPGTPPASVPAVLGTNETAPSGPTSEFISGTPGTPASPGAPGGPLAAPSTQAQTPAVPTRPLGAVRRIVSEKPLWLLLFYFMWQAALIGTAASLWWWRMAEQA